MNVLFYYFTLLSVLFAVVYQNTITGITLEALPDTNHLCLTTIPGTGFIPHAFAITEKRIVTLQPARRADYITTSAAALFGSVPATTADAITAKWLRPRYLGMHRFLCTPYNAPIVVPDKLPPYTLNPTKEGKNCFTFVFSIIWR